MQKKKLSEELRKHFSELGRKGYEARIKKYGPGVMSEMGKARIKKYGPGVMSEIAKKRWDKEKKKKNDTYREIGTAEPKEKPNE